MKWITTTEYVDEETGQQLKKSHVTKGHYVVKQTKFVRSIQHNSLTTERQFIKVCIKNNQLNLWKS